MKVLIGTPIHESKDYSMERWLQNVVRLQHDHPAELLLVDNSHGTRYVKKVTGYCKKYGVRNYKIEHVDFPPLQGTQADIAEQIHERICRCREIIRQHVLSHDYDAWFCWESDQIIPTNGLGKLVQLLKAEDLLVVNHNCWVNNIPNQINFDYGVALFNRKCLEKYGFIPVFGPDPDMTTCWYDAEMWFRKRLHQDRCKYTEVMGLIEPIYHLSK